MIRGLKMQFRCAGRRFPPRKEPRQVLSIGFKDEKIDAELKNVP